MKFKKILFFLFICTLPQLILADPPEPELGTRWVINGQYSDEFNADKLDRSKWNPYYNGWEGRPPGKFVPESVSLKNGCMQIENGIIKKRKEHTKEKGYSIRGGAVQSIQKTAYFGYYECRFKASRINMSTTFWMSNGKIPVNFPTRKSNGTNCYKDSYSQELDICESIGGNITRGDGFRKKMNFNTHYRYIDCNGGKEKFYSRGNNVVEGSGANSNANLSTESWEDFHIYAAHWKNANEVDFYADNKLAGEIKISTEVVDKPFPRPMGINMVTETYDWAKPYPINKELTDKSINTSYYDWVRSYKSIGIDQSPNPNSKPYYPSIYNEDFSFFEKPIFNEDKTSLILPYIYKANEDRILILEIMDKNNTIVTTGQIPLYAGYGKDKKTVDIGNSMQTGVKIIAKVKSKNGAGIIKQLVIE